MPAGNAWLNTKFEDMSGLLGKEDHHDGKHRVAADALEISSSQASQKTKNPSGLNRKGFFKFSVRNPELEGESHLRATPSSAWVGRAIQVGKSVAVSHITRNSDHAVDLHGKCETELQVVRTVEEVIRSA